MPSCSRQSASSMRAPSSRNRPTSDGGKSRAAPRTILVTGANRGLGLETARQLALRGDHVIVTSRDESSGRRAVEDLGHEGVAVDYRRLDVTNAADVTRIAAEFGKGP